MWIYTFYVRLLIKKLLSFSRGQLNNLNIVHIYRWYRTEALGVSCTLSRHLVIFVLFKELGLIIYLYLVILVS